MIECPELVALESSPLLADVQAHVEACASCSLVVELFAQSRGVANADRDCLRFDALLAARGDGTLGSAGINLLERHLAGCDDCRAVAETLSPTADARGDHATFPKVDPGAYALGLEVGKGGMGRVLAARDLRVGRSVAVKELRGRSPQLAARFEREARVTARLQHPGIVPIYEVGRWPDGTPFYSMRMVEGRTLREALDKAGTLAARITLLPAVIAAAKAVAFAHGQRVIHRDLTPSNVMVGPYGETVVIDWGLAKDLADTALDPEPDAGPYRDDSSDLTGVGAVLGTAAYMPPEQANAAPVDERADVYALGAILYHLLAGAAPYRTDSSADVLSALKAGPPRPVERISPNAPRDLVSIVAKAMTRDASARYPSARELADELERFQTGRLVEAHVYTTGERMRRFAARNRASLTVSVVGVAILSILGTVAVRRVIRERRAAETTVLTLLEQEGRVALLAGNSLPALTYLEEAYERTADPQAALRFMRATALRDISTVDGDLDCGSDVRDLDFGAGGSTLAAACSDRAKLWRLDDRSLIAMLGPFEGGFAHLGYSHDGKTLATWGSDGNARLWDATTGALLHTLPHAVNVAITFVTFTPDDGLVSTSGHDGWAKIWNARTGELVRPIQGSDALLHHLYGVFSHDGARLLTFTIEGIGAGWDVATGEKVAGGFEHGSVAVGGELWSGGPLAATCGMNRLVKIWNTDTGKLVVQLAGATNVVWTCKFSQDGQLVLGTSHDGRAYVWSVATGAAIALVDHGSPIWTGHFAPDGKRFVTVSLVGSSVKVWDTATGGRLASHDTQGGEEAKFSPDGTRLVAGLGDGRIRIWHGPDGPLRATYTAAADEDLLAVTADGARALTQGPDGWVAVRETTSGRALAGPRIKAPIAASTSRVAGMSADQSIEVIDARDGSAIATLEVAAPPTALALTRDGLRIVVEFSARDVEVWDIDHRTRIAILDGSRHAVASLDGRRALGWTASSPRVWAVDEHEVISTLATARTFQPIGFAAGGHRLVLDEEVAGVHAIAIWNADTGTSIARIPDPIGTPTIDPAGRYLTSILANHTVETRDLLSNRIDEPSTAFFSDHLQQAQLDPQGELIAGIDELGETVSILNATDGRLLARWPIAHAPPLISQDGYESPRAIARWSADGKAIVTIPDPDVTISGRIKAALIAGPRTPARVAVWNADPDFYDARGAVLSGDRLAALVKRTVPWQVADGRLVPALATLRGRVVRGDSPVSDATIRPVFRKPPELGGEIMRRRVAITNKPLDPVSVGPDGSFSRDLPPGRYTLTIEEAGRPRKALDIDLSVGDGPRDLDLATLH